MATIGGYNVVTSGLVLSLDAANRRSYVSGSNTWFDVSGNGNSGSLINGPGFNSANGGSLVFDGVDDYALVTGSITTTQATFLAWIKRNGDQSAYDGIIYSRSTNVTGMGFHATATSNNISYTWNGAANTYDWNTGLTTPNQEWCMCVISVLPTFATAYLCQQSGIQSATNIVSHNSTTLNNINIARDSQGNRNFTGNITIAQIYNRALSAAEVLQNYNATKGRFGL